VILALTVLPSAQPVFTGTDIFPPAEFAARRAKVIDRISDGVFIEVRRCPKKRCLALSKADRAADFACPFSVPVSPVMLAARIAASRLLWMMLNAPA